MTRRLERDLLAAGERIVRVPPKLMAHARDAARTYGKSDPIDALAVTRAALREDSLPTAHLDEADRDLRLLVDHREDLIAERTRAINRLRWHLHELDPEWDLQARPTSRSCYVRRATPDLALQGRSMLKGVIGLASCRRRRGARRTPTRPGRRVSPAARCTLPTGNAPWASGVHSSPRHPRLSRHVYPRRLRRQQEIKPAS
jgi:transposase